MTQNGHICVVLSSRDAFGDQDACFRSRELVLTKLSMMVQRQRGEDLSVASPRITIVSIDIGRMKLRATPVSWYLRSRAQARKACMYVTRGEVVEHTVTPSN